MINRPVADVRSDAWIDPLTYDLFADGAVIIPAITALILAAGAVLAVVLVTR